MASEAHSSTTILDSPLSIGEGHIACSGQHTHTTCSLLASPSQLGSQYFGYIHGRIFGAARRANRAQFQVAEEKEHLASSEAGDDRYQEDEEVSPTQMINEIIEGLDAHVRRIHLVEHESPEVADYLSSALIALLEHGTIHCGQEHLNAAREAILPLLDLSRFERRYVLQPPWNREG